MNYILSIDQSTSGTKGLLWNLKGKLIARSNVYHRQITTPEGWIEHDPMEIYDNCLEAARRVLEDGNVPPESIRVIGISNQRETAVCWDRISGAPVCNTIVWQCSRAADIAEEADVKCGARRIREKTGLNLSPYFSAAKFGWMIKHVPKAKECVENGTLCCGTVDSWLVYKLTEGARFKTDYSNASRTQLLNLDTLCWDDEILNVFGIPKTAMPEICHSDSLFGDTTFGGLFPKPVAIHGVMGDSHAALFAHNCADSSMAKVTYGTGSSIMVNVGTVRPKKADGVVTSIAWGIQGQVRYVLEGNINYTGAVTKWLVDDLELLNESREAGAVAATVPDTGGVYLVPAFSGLGAPYFNDKARAAILGMSRATKKAHVVRAAEECIAFQIKDVVEAIKNKVPELSEIRADGGPTKDDFLMQFQADILALPLYISETEELSGAGAAYCAALGAGLTSVESVFSSQKYKRRIPSMNVNKSTGLYEGWLRAVSQVACNHKEEKNG